MKKNSQGFSLIGFLIILATFSTACIISILVFNFVKIKTNNKLVMIIFVAITILMFSILSTIIDIFRRKFTIEKSVNKILDATEKIAQGDFNVRLIPIHQVSKYNEFDYIIENINLMAQELSKNELLKNDFIANVSHEIKTPLSIIQNYAMLIKSKNITDEKRDEYASILISTTKKITNLVTNILKLNKLENQQLIKTDKNFNLGEQVRQAVLNFEDIIENKNLNLICDIDDFEICSAEDYLDIVWQNLISNAVKFTDSGYIKVEVKKQGKFAVVKFSDSGIGMSAEVGNRIFDKFYQEDTSRSSLGNGLGLALVKRVIDNIGGEINVESKVNQGSTFTIKIRTNINE